MTNKITYEMFQNIKEDLTKTRKIIEDSVVEDAALGCVKYGSFDEEGEFEVPSELPNIPELEQRIKVLITKLNHIHNMAYNNINSENSATLKQALNAIIEMAKSVL